MRRERAHIHVKGRGVPKDRCIGQPATLLTTRTVRRYTDHVTSLSAQRTFPDRLEQRGGDCELASDTNITLDNHSLYRLRCRLDRQTEHLYVPKSSVSK